MARNTGKQTITPRTRAESLNCACSVRISLTSPCFSPSRSQLSSCNERNKIFTPRGFTEEAKPHLRPEARGNFLFRPPNYEKAVLCPQAGSFTQGTADSALGVLKTGSLGSQLMCGLCVAGQTISLSEPMLQRKRPSGIIE